MMRALIFCALFPFLSYAQDVRFETDRPDKTRPAQTVNPRRFIVESGYITNLKQLETQVRYGLSESSEAQFAFSPLVEEENSTLLAYQYNFSGNQGEDFGWGLLGYVSLERLEGGISLPLSYNLPREWEGSLTLEANNVREDTDDWQMNFSGALSLGHSIFRDDLFGYIEIFHQHDTNRNVGDVTTLDLSIQFDLNSRVKLDGGTFISLNNNTGDVYFIGAAFLF